MKLLFRSIRTQLLSPPSYNALSYKHEEAGGFRILLPLTP